MMDNSQESPQNKESLGHRLVTSRLLLVTVVFVLALIPRCLDLGVFVGPDEFSWVNRSANFARALRQGDLAQTYQTGHPGVTVLWAETTVNGARQLLGLPSLLASPSAENDIRVLAAHRQVIACLNALLLALAALMTRSLFGSAAGWLAGFLLAFSPFLLTESRALRTEGLVTGFATLALLALLLYARNRRLSYAALAGALTALALLSKVSAVALLPVVLVVFLAAVYIDPGQSRRGLWRDLLLPLAVWGGVLLLVLVALWPALWVAPVEVAGKMWAYIGFRAVEGGGGGKSFFMGLPAMSASLSFLFYAVVLLYRSSPVVWVGLLGLVALVFDRRPLARKWRWSLAGIALYCAAYLVLISRTDLKYDRYIIPLLPPLAVAAAVGMVTMWRRVTGQWAVTGRLGWLAVLVVLAAQMGLAVPHHPYYYTYWNPLLGGVQGAVNVLPVGMGGEGIDRVVAYLNALPDSEHITLASANSQKIKPVFEGDTISMTNLDGEWFLADYTLIYISQLQRGKHFPTIIRYLDRNQPELIVNLGGLDYGWLYRGPSAQFWGGDTKLEGQATLHAFNLSAAQLRAGETLTVTVFYRREGDGQGDTFYVRLVDGEGYSWAESVVHPLPGFEEAAVTRSEIVEGQALLMLPQGMLPGTYRLQMGYVDAMDGTSIGMFQLPADSDTVRVDWPVKTVSASLPAAPCLVIGNNLALTEYDLPSLDSTGGTEQWVTLHWQALKPISHDYVLLLRLLDGQDEELSYRLGPPARSELPTSQWQPGQVILDPWLLEVPSVCHAGQCHLELSVFDAVTQVEVSWYALLP